MLYILDIILYYRKIFIKNENEEFDENNQK